MKSIICSVILALAAIISTCNAKPNIGGFVYHHSNGKTARVEFADCGGPDAIVTINSAIIGPDPIEYPGSITVETDLTYNQDLPRAEISIDLRKLGLFPIDIPCIGDLGACTYDVCEFAASDMLCGLFPVDEQGFCGSCETPAGNYATESPITIELPDYGAIIGALLKGRYDTTLTVHAPGNKAEKYLCLKAEIEIV